MHSLPTNISATKCVVLKHKLPTQLRRKLTNAKVANVGNTNTNSNTNNTNSQHTNVDADLLATVLRVHVESKLRREQVRQRQHKTLKTRVLQRAVNALDEPMVTNELCAAKDQFGFRDALVQLSHFQH